MIFDGKCPLILDKRARPAKHRENLSGAYSIIFVTVCTKFRLRVLADSYVHEILVAFWKDSSQWVVGRYVVMPDHIHLFVRAAGGSGCVLSQWVGSWKRHVSASMTRSKKISPPLWQDSFWGTKISTDEMYVQKLSYVQENPVRAGLVVSADEWPFSGSIHELRW